MQELLQSLKSHFKGDIYQDAETLEKYSRDASLFKITPEIAVAPKDAADLKTIIEAVYESRKHGRNAYITARSAGTDMSGGSIGESMIVDFTKYFNNIREVGNGWAVAEPGVHYRDFDKETKAKIGMIMPSYPASRELCTIGGMVANNSGGEKTLLYGKTEDYVMELKVVLRDGNEYTIKPLTLAELEEKKKLNTFEGELYRKLHELIESNYDKIMAAKPNVSKNSAGYYLWNVLDKQKGTFNLCKLIVGSQGTLALVTQIKFRLIKPKTHSRLLVVFLKDLTHLGDITNHILSFKPESLESYDDHTFKLALKFLPSLIKHMKGNMLSLAIRFIPEFFTVLTGGMPKLVVMAEFTADTDEEAHNQAMLANASLQGLNLKTRVTDSNAEVGKYWAIRRESFNLLRQHVKLLRTAPFIDDFVVKPEHLPEFLPKLYAILDQYKDITYTIAGHVGDGNFHIIPLMDLTDPHSKVEITEIMEKVMTLIFEYKGSMTGEHNDGIIRTPYLTKMFGADITKLFEETKNIFDPDRIFNPGKKVGGTLQYALDHLDTKYK